MKKTLGLAFLSILIAACGGDDDLSPEEVCRENVSVTCDKAFECLDAEDLQFDSAAECRTALSAECVGTTEAELCGAGFTLDGEAADACLDGLDGSSCAQFAELLNGDIDEEDIDEACGRVCVSTALRLPAVAPMVSAPLKACVAE